MHATARRCPRDHLQPQCDAMVSLITKSTDPVRARLPVLNLTTTPREQCLRSRTRASARSNLHLTRVGTLSGVQANGAWSAAACWRASPRCSSASTRRACWPLPATASGYSTPPPRSAHAARATLVRPAPPRRRRTTGRADNARAQPTLEAAAEPSRVPRVVGMGLPLACCVACASINYYLGSTTCFKE